MWETMRNYYGRRSILDRPVWKSMGRNVSEKVEIKHLKRSNILSTWKCGKSIETSFRHTARRVNLLS